MEQLLAYYRKSHQPAKRLATCLGFLCLRRSYEGTSEIVGLVCDHLNRTIFVNLN